MLNDRVRQWTSSFDSDSNEQSTPMGPAAFELMADEETEIKEPGFGPELSTTESDEASEEDLAELVAEVGAVLKSAQEAATRIRESARAEASKVHTETRAWVESEFAATWREAAALRAEAEAFAEAEIRGARQEAEALRAEAQALQKEDAAKALQLIADAENEAQRIREAARSRLQIADAEVEEKLRQAEAEIRARRDAFESEAVRHREWLGSMLGAFQGISLELQGLLEAPHGDSGELVVDPSDPSS
jgi:F0F1-type ATP synthase membrane subunit b/b'